MAPGGACGEAGRGRRAAGQRQPAAGSRRGATSATTTETLSRAPAASAAATRRSAHSSRAAMPRRSAIRVVVEGVGQPVRAQEQPVAGARGDGRHGGRPALRVAVEGLEDERALRMRARLGGGDGAAVDEALDEAVVAGEAPEGAVAEEVGARVADVRDEVAVVVERDRGQGRAHPGHPGAAAGDEPDRRVARGDGGRQRAVERLVDAALVEVDQRVDRRPAGDLARGGAADAVGDRGEPRARVGRVLVVPAHRADVGPDGRAEAQGRHRAARYRAPRHWTLARIHSARNGSAIHARPRSRPTSSSRASASTAFCVEDTARSACRRR